VLSKRVEVDVGAGIERLCGIWHVVEPAGIRSGGDREARIKQDAREQEDPVREGIEPRKRHVAGPNDQRLQEHAEAGEHRKCVPQDHRDPVHAEQLVILFGREQMLFRAGKLQPDHERLDASRNQEYERRHDVADADLLVIDCRQPTVDAGLGLPNRLQPARHRRAVVLRHDVRHALIGRRGHGAVTPKLRENVGYARAPGLTRRAAASRRRA
jgi:hypothetical protein